MLEKRYNFKESEKRWKEFWQKEKIFEIKKGKEFSIDTPPPTVSAGHLHIGHAMHYSQFEFIARFKRMQGFNVLFPMGFDDNGLPTEKFVEEKLKIKAKDFDREKFRNLCLKESEKVERDMKEFFLSLGFSCQWPAYRTIDKKSQKIAQLSFLDLYKKNFLYRKEEPVLFCCNDETALAQATVEDLKRKTTLNYIYFKIKNKKIPIATTRPELLASCVAVFVNPKDKKNKNLIGKKAVVPLFNFEVPILKDESVDPKFGSGIVMCCTFGDSQDVLWWKKHKLPLKISIKENGKMNELTGKYEGMTIEEARKKIINELGEKGFLEKQEEIEQTVSVCWRCKTPVELIPKEQWFLKILNFKKKFIEHGKKIKWFPEFYFKRYEDWIKNLRWDWCISRQRYYGVPIPVWYCENCKKILIPKEKELPIDPCEVEKKCPKCGSRTKAEKDVFDTWFTSSLTPEIVKGLSSKSLPFSLRPQAHDIIRTWAFYTIVKAFFHFKKIPWKEIMISGHGLDERGKAMHKSKGNVIWASDILEKYGADCIRYWSTTASLGEDIKFKEQDLKRGTIVLTKIWNSARFLSIFLKNKIKIKKKLSENIVDRWILSRIKKIKEKYLHLFENYKISQARKIIEIFFKHEFCDFYLEFIKYRLYGKNEKTKIEALQTAYYSLLEILKMFAPFLPFITEEIYQKLFKKFEKQKSIHSMKIEKEKFYDKNSEEIGKVLIRIITEIRKLKQKKNLSFGTEIENALINFKNLKTINSLKEEIKNIGRIKNLEIKKGEKLKVSFF